MDRSKSLTRKPIYQLRVSLVGVEPEVWRRMLVTGNLGLGKLHELIQLTVGWKDCHLHMFRLGDGRRFGPAHAALEELDLEDERRVKLRTVAPETGSSFWYHYDFGDDWTHQVLVEDIITPQEAGLTPRCIDGRRACPPEDVGGPPGYQQYLAALEDARHPDHQQMRRWRGPFDAEAFDLDRVNLRLGGQPATTWVREAPAPARKKTKASKAKKAKRTTRTKKAWEKARLDALVEEAIVDAHDEEEQLMGLFSLLQDNLMLPFETTVLGVAVTVVEVELVGSHNGHIVAICRRGRHRQAIPITSLPLPEPRPEGAEWIDAYRHWLGE
jgi:hypothetical protein